MTNEVDSEEIKLSSQALREFANRHMGSTTILAALGAVLDAQVTGTPLHPTIQVRVDEVLDALKIDNMTEGVNAADLRRMLAEIRFKRSSEKNNQDRGARCHQHIPPWRHV